MSQVTFANPVTSKVYLSQQKKGNLALLLLPHILVHWFIKGTAFIHIYEATKHNVTSVSLQTTTAPVDESLIKALSRTPPHLPGPSAPDIRRGIGCLPNAI